MLNLIKLVIFRAVERIVSLVSPADVKETAVDRIVRTTTTDELVDALVKHECVERQFNNLTSKAVAKHIDTSDLAWNIDLSELAVQIDLGDLGDNLDYVRLAKVVEATKLIPEAVSLEERINEAISHGVANALDVANRRTEPVIEQSPDLIARLLDLAVEKLLARADEAAKNGEV